MSFQQQTNTTMRKVTGLLNAGSFKYGTFREIVKDFLASEQAFNFMNTIKATPAYRKRF